MLVVCKIVRSTQERIVERERHWEWLWKMWEVDIAHNSWKCSAFWEPENYRLERDIQINRLIKFIMYHVKKYGLSGWLIFKYF
jgi:hypothetical protein